MVEVTSNQTTEITPHCLRHYWRISNVDPTGTLTLHIKTLNLTRYDNVTIFDSNVEERPLASIDGKYNRYHEYEHKSLFSTSKDLYITWNSYTINCKIFGKKSCFYDTSFNEFRI